MRDDFDYIGENGRPVARGEIPYRFVRRKDGKVFKWARFAPQYTEVHKGSRGESKRYDFMELGDQRSYGWLFKRSTTADETLGDHPI